MRLKLNAHCGTFFLTDPCDTYVGKSLEVYGEWSFGEVELLAKLLRIDDNVLELGANIGAHTVFLARDVVPKGNVYAFEPRRHLFQQLCANVALNSLPNVHAFQLAAGSRASLISEGVHPSNIATNMGAFPLGKIEGEGEVVEVVRIDDRLDRFRKIALVKADVEGYERDCLEGAQGLIRRDRPLLYLENDRLENSGELISHVFGLGYECWWHTVPLYRQQNFSHTFVDIFGGKYSFNMLCIPKERGVRIAGLRQVRSADEHPLKRVPVPA